MSKIWYGPSRAASTFQICKVNSPMSDRINRVRDLSGNKPPVRVPNYPLPPLRPYNAVGDAFETWTILNNRDYGPRTVVRYLKQEAAKQANSHGYFHDSGLSRTSENEIEQVTGYLLVIASDVYTGVRTSTFGCVNAGDWGGDNMEPFFTQPCNIGDALHALQHSGAIENRRLLLKSDPATKEDHRRLYDKIRQWDEEQQSKWDAKFAR